MSLRLVYGRIGTGKTAFCMRDALSRGTPVAYITPEQYTFTAEKRLCSMANVHGLGGVDVLSFKRLASRILAGAEGAALPLLDTRTKAILMQKILLENVRKLKVLHKTAEEHGAAGELVAFFSECKRYHITPESLRMAAEKLPDITYKLQDLALLLDVYQTVLRDKFSDRDDDMDRLAHILLSYHILQDTEIYLDRFDGFDPAEYACITAMLKTARRVTVTLPLGKNDRSVSPFLIHAHIADKLLYIAKENGIPVEQALEMKRPSDKNPELSFLENNFFSYPADIFPHPSENIRLVTAANPLGEIHYVAREIMRLCREEGYLFRDIAIAARNTDMYEQYIDAVLPTYGIAYFMDRSIHVLEHPFTVFILSALEIIVKGYTYESMFRYIKSGFLRMKSDAVDALENYVLAAGIRGDTWKNEEKWNARIRAYTLQDTEEDIKAQTYADKTRRRIMQPILCLADALRNGKTAAEKCEAVYAFLEHMKSPRRIQAIAKLFETHGDMSTAMEYRNVYNVFIDALDGICDTFGEEDISIRRFYDILRIALGEVEAGIIPASQDGVMVGSVDRIKGYDVKALFVIGVLDGVFPASPMHNGILNDAERLALTHAGIEIAASDTKTLPEEEHLIYKCLTIPSTFLTVSFPGADMEGKTLRPSRIYTRIKEIFPQVQEISELVDVTEEAKISAQSITLPYIIQSIRNHRVSKEMRMAYAWFMEHEPEKLEKAKRSLTYTNMAQPLSESTVASFMQRGLTTSISRLEKLAACPFAYYATYMLDAKERKIMQPAATDAGRFLHDFIDLFSRRLHQHKVRWQDVDDAYMEEEFLQIVPMLDHRLSSYMLSNSARYARLFIRLQNSMKTSIRFLVQHMKKCAFEPLGYELSFDDKGDLLPLSFTLPGGTRVKLTGRIDRADILKLPEKKGTLVRIIDYKSGAKEFDLGDVYAGLNLQLAVYLTSICAPENQMLVGENAHPAGMLYFRLSDPIVSLRSIEDIEDASKKRSDKFKLNGLVLCDEEVLRAMDHDIAASSDVLPARITKNGVGGSVASSDQFAKLSAHVKKTVLQLLQTLEKGQIDIRPYKKNDASACTYCAYSAFCAHTGQSYRLIDKKPAEEIWKALEVDA